MVSPSSSSSYARKTYDVFLSFRGDDTRRSFTDHLYANLRQAGVNTFRDDEDIPRGENISDELLKAIQESRISIVVFSKRYAGSRWCLDELVKIMECKQKLNQIVIPIFYDVDPSEVRKQTGEFGDAFTQHKKKFGSKKINEWKDALTMAANLSGWDLRAMTNWYETKFIEKIIEHILLILNIVPMDVAKYPVGIDSRMVDILDLLQIQKNDYVKMIGISGMGGIGKTTLAKAIYNYLSFHQGFEGSCFISNIGRKVSTGHNGLVRLQEKLLRKTLKRKKFEIDDVDEGISLIKTRLQSKRIVIVLDDIDHISQLDALAGQRDWFGRDSIVIITTRNVHLLRELGARETYMIETLSYDESLQLLSYHAFGVPLPPDDYTELCERIVNYTGRLPLALTVLGSHLRGRSVEEWSKDVEKLRLMLNDDVLEILRISYDALDPDTQSIFLDIACFLIGQDKNDIIQGFGYRFEIGIRILTERCLLTIHRSGGREKLQMHDLVLAMAWEIVRRESPRDPSRRSRLMDPNDVYDVLQGNKGTKAIEGLYVDSSMLKNDHLNTKAFSKMTNLRLLILDGANLEASFKHLPKGLRWFWWHNCHLRLIPHDFQHAKLEALHLQGSNIKRVKLSMQHFKRLKILDLGGCEQLIEAPDFTGAQSLEIVSFKRCSNLVTLHPSIGSLKRLIELDFTSCQKLKKLPNSICKLKSLQLLKLNDCSKLRELPIELGKLEQLRKLHASRTNISHLPFSLGCLRSLKILSVGRHKESNSQLGDIPICDPVGFFPPTVANLSSLGALYITDNYLREVDFPINLERLSLLKVLSLKGSHRLQSLPFSLCHLSKLESLILEDCLNLKALPELPSNLEKFSAKDCISLEKIADISKLKRLKELYIPNCNSLVELPGLESLDSIQRLDVTNCSALSIPLIENCFQAHVKGDDVDIWVHMVGYFLCCTIPLVLTHEFFDIIHGGFDPKYFCEARIIVRSKTTGAFIVKEVDHVDCMCLKHHHPLTLHFGLEDDDILTNTIERYHFKLRIKVGEEVEVYAVFHPLKIYCVCVLHRNRDGEVHFFPSTKGFQEFDESTEKERHVAPEEEVGDSSWEKEETGGVPILEIIEEIPGQGEVMQSEDEKKVAQPQMPPPPAVPPSGSNSEQIDELFDKATRLVAEVSKLNTGILELMDLNKEAITPEIKFAMNMLKVHSEGYTTSLEMTQCLLEPLKKYKVERKARLAVEDGRLPEKPEGVEDDKVLELFFTPNKFQGQVVKFGESIEVTGSGMCSLKPGEMIQDDVINSYEFILREKAGTQPKCWYLPTYIWQESFHFCDTYERNFKPYVTTSSCDIIYLPLYLNAHWYLVKANTKWKQALILDSFILPDQRQARLEEAIKIMGVLHNLLKQHALQDPTYKYEADFEDWKFEMPDWVPQQDNGVDCGAFVMLFMEMAEQLTKHTIFNIAMERKRIALQLLYHPNNARLSLVYNSVKDSLQEKCS